MSFKNTGNRNTSSSAVNTQHRCGSNRCIDSSAHYRSLTLLNLKHGTWPCFSTMSLNWDTFRRSYTINKSAVRSSTINTNMIEALPNYQFLYLMISCRNRDRSMTIETCIKISKLFSHPLKLIKLCRSYQSLAIRNDCYSMAGLTSTIRV